MQSSKDAFFATQNAIVNKKSTSGRRNRTWKPLQQLAHDSSNDLVFFLLSCFQFSSFFFYETFFKSRLQAISNPC